MNKFDSLYNKILSQNSEISLEARNITRRNAYFTNIAEEYPPQVVELYEKYMNTKKEYLEKKYEKTKQWTRENFLLSEDNILANIANAIANTYIKTLSNSDIQTLSKDEIKKIYDSEKELKAQLIEYYQSNKVSIEDWKKLAKMIHTIKNDPEIIQLHRKLTALYDELPATLRSRMDLPDKSKISVVDEIINQRLALKNYADSTDSSQLTPAEEIEISKNFIKRELVEEEIYSVLTRLNGKHFIITYTTSSSNEPITRVGQLNVMKYNLTKVQNPLEASNRLANYNNITYFDLSIDRSGYRTAKLSNVISISVGNFEKGVGVTYIIKH